MNLRTILGILTATLITASAGANPIQDMMERNAVTVSFAEDSAVLSDAHKGALNALIAGRDGGNSAKAAVAAWSDKPFPEEGAKLARADIELAKQRADAVVKHLESLARYRSVFVVNMAKRENVFSRFFATNAARVKAAVDGAVVPSPWAQNEAAVFKTHGAPGRAVIIVYDEAESLAH